MPGYDVAHIRKEGQDTIIVPVEPKFGHLSSSDQHGFIAQLEACARSAGLAGHVVPVWNEGNEIRFLAPSPWHSFFQSVTPQWIQANINKRLTCG